MAAARRSSSLKGSRCKVCGDYFDKSEVFEYECGCCACVECLMGNISANRIGGRKNLSCLSCHNVKRNKEQEDKVLDALRKWSLQNEDYSDVFQKFQTHLTECLESEGKTFCAHPPCTASFVRTSKNRAMTCEVCKKKTCHNCKLPWHMQHKNTPCSRYKQWVMENKPEWYIPADLEDLCFTCPNCRKQFEMVRGGCLHFDCPSCGFEFCGFCREPFHTEDRNPCKICPRGANKGMHAHHPRICPYFLRDKEVDWLWKLVEIHGKTMDSLLPPNHSNGKLCGVKFNTDHGATNCTEPVGASCQGFCKRHFQESISGAIFRAKNIDPIVLMDAGELRILAERERIKMESNLDEEKMRSVIIRNIPLVATPVVDVFFKCPNCSTTHPTYRDGTIRFECTNCFCSFCGFCCQMFIAPPLECPICPKGSKKGIHAHHPRTCPYYLRDEEVSWFWRLLEKHERAADKMVSMNPTKGEECGFLFRVTGKKGEQKCTQKPEEKCQGYCPQHFIQLASEAILKSKDIDPAAVMNIGQLQAILKRDNVTFEESWNEEKLRQIIATQLPLKSVRTTKG